MHWVVLYKYEESLVCLLLAWLPIVLCNMFTELLDFISDVCLSSIEVVDDELTLLRKDLEKLCEKKQLFSEDLDKVFHYSLLEIYS